MAVQTASFGMWGLPQRELSGGKKREKKKFTTYCGVVGCCGVQCNMEGRSKHWSVHKWMRRKKKKKKKKKKKIGT